MWIWCAGRLRSVNICLRCLHATAEHWNKWTNIHAPTPRGCEWAEQPPVAGLRSKTRAAATAVSLHILASLDPEASRLQQLPCKHQSSAHPMPATWVQADWPLLVIAPASLRLNWAEELEKWLPLLRPAHVRVIEGREDRLRPGDSPKVRCPGGESQPLSAPAHGSACVWQVVAGSVTGTVCCQGGCSWPRQCLCLGQH